MLCVDGRAARRLKPLALFTVGTACVKANSRRRSAGWVRLGPRWLKGVSSQGRGRYRWR